MRVADTRQYPGKPDAWAAKLVVESEPRWFRTFLLSGRDESKLRQLDELKLSEAAERRTVKVYRGDFNERVHQNPDAS